MSKRLSSCPIRIVLMPGHYSAMMSRFAEELVVPEANRSAKKLRCWGCKCRMPEEIMKTGRYPPCAQRMEQHVIRIIRLVRVIFVKQISLLDLCVKQSIQFAPEHSHLFVRQNADSL